MPWTPPPEDLQVSAPPAPGTTPSSSWTPPQGDTVLAQPAGAQANDKATFGLALRASAQAGLFGSIPAWLTRNTAADVTPHASQGIGEAFTAGLQGSSGGLLVRGNLPAVVLDPQHAKWYEKLAAGAGSFLGDAPAMVAGGLGAGAAGIETGPGAIALGGAAAFAAPTALREALVSAYTLDQVTSASDFLHRTAISVAKTGGSALVGAATAGTGNVVGKFATPFVGEGLAKVASVGAEVGTMTTASAALEGKLPEPEDFLNAAIMVGGLHMAGSVSGRLRTIYAKTGVPPEQVAAEAHADPVLKAELLAPESGAPILEAARTAGAARVEGLRPQVNGEADAALANPGPILDAYSSDPRTEGGKIVNGDIMAEVASPTVAGNRTEGHFLMGEHGAANQLANDLFEQRMAQPPATPDEAVLIMVGNAATGKSTLARNNAENYHTVLDTNGADPKGLDNAINLALNSGRKVDVLLTHADLPEAVQRNIQRQADQGRPVSILDQANLAVNAPASFASAAETHGANPDVSFNVADSTPGKEAHFTGQEAIDFANGLREENRGRSTLQVATDAYTNHLRSGNARPTEAARVAFERSNEARTDASLSEKQNAGAALPGNEGDGGGEPPASGGHPQPAVALPTAYQPVADAQAVRDAIPGVAAQVAQEFYGPTIHIPDEPEPTQVNYQYLNTPSQVDGALVRLSQLTEEAIQNQRRGSVNWQQTEAEAGQYLANLLGSEQPIPSRKPGTAVGAAELLARKQLVEGAANDMAVQAQKYRDLGTNASPEDTAAFLASIDRCALIQQQFLGARAEAGRALNILQNTTETAARAQQIQDVLNRFGKDPRQLAEMMAAINNPEGATRFARKAVEATKWDMVMEAYKAGLLGPITVVKKSLSDIAMMVSRPIVDTLAYGFNRLSGAEERMSAVEPIARVIGNINGVSEGLTQALGALKSETFGGINENRGVIPGVGGEIIRLPFRGIEAVTELFKCMEERGEAYAQAARRAAAEGIDPGTHEFTDKVADYALNPTEEQAGQIKEFGQRATYQAPLGPVGQTFLKLVRMTHTEPIFPFVKAPANVFTESARLSPFAPLVGDWRADFGEGGIARSKAVAEMAVGSALTGLGLAWAASGRISGSGDPDPAKRRIQMASGWQPYSIKLGDTWYSYRMIHPLGTLLGMTADIHEMGQYMDQNESDKALKVAGNAFAHAVTEQTFLQGMDNAVHALDDPAKGMQTFLQNTAAGLVPATISQTALLIHQDPYKRQIDSIKDAVQARIPGLREDLMPQRDPFGEPIANDKRLGILSPIITKEPSTDPVRLEAARLGVGAQAVPRAIQIPALGQRDIGKVPLSPGQRDVFGDVSGHLAYQVMDQLVNNPLWAAMPDMAKQKAFETTFEHANQVGKAAALSDEQRQQEIQRITAEVSKRLSSSASH